MIVVHVSVHVLPDYIDAFQSAAIENAKNSVLEPGIARFDVIQRIEDPTRFELVEVYRSEEAIVAHKQTVHYAKWRDTVQEMMAEPRTSIKFNSVYPDDAGW